MTNSDVVAFVLFGGSGDLAKRKLYPSLYLNFIKGLLPGDCKIFSVSRLSEEVQAFQAEIFLQLERYVSPSQFSDEKAKAFVKCIRHIQLDVTRDDAWETLETHLERFRHAPIVYYLSVAPRFFGDIAKGIASVSLNQNGARLVVEKPFGHDFESARALNKELRLFFDEHQIFRIDHYLGKESIQNILALRFSNNIFESQWHAGAIESVQITVAEKLGVGDRGDYYDNNGASKDMLQNHMMQLLSIVAMEPPFAFSPDAIRDEKVKLLRSLRPIDADSYSDSCVRGQYVSGQGEASYLEDVDKESSDCETYIAIKGYIDNRRWAGTPFYLRTGKRLAGGVGEIVINFKPSNPELIKSKDGLCSNNKLVINFQPDQDIFLFINKKDNQSESFSVDTARLQLSTKSGDLKQPYERLLGHVLAGDQTLFVRDDEIEVAWKWLDQLAASWEQGGSSPYPYKGFSQGPIEADKLFVESNGWEPIK